MPGMESRHLYLDAMPSGDYPLRSCEVTGATRMPKPREGFHLTRRESRRSTVAMQTTGNGGRDMVGRGLLCRRASVILVRNPVWITDRSRFGSLWPTLLHQLYVPH